jgi:hypothetical protein
MMPDGVSQPAPPPGLDVRAMLPLIRARSAEVAVEHLAAVAGVNALAVLQTPAPAPTRHHPPGAWLRRRST